MARGQQGPMGAPPPPQPKLSPGGLPIPPGRLGTPGTPPDLTGGLGGMMDPSGGMAMAGRTDPMMGMGGGLNSAPTSPLINTPAAPLGGISAPPPRTTGAVPGTPSFPTGFGSGLGADRGIPATPPPPQPPPPQPPLPYKKPGGNLAAQQLGLGVFNPAHQWGKMTPGGLPPR
jgi:hypothetical protein